MSKIVTRFAPSPTGFLHVGGLRTALYSFLYARHNDGQFLLRIEDTDRERLVPGATENLIKILNDFGLTPDNEKPMIQSERLAVYQKYARELVERGKAYYCFCSAERLDEIRQEQMANKQPPRYDGFCRNITLTEADAKVKAGAPFVIRLYVEEGEDVKLNDIVRGEIVFKTGEIDDCVLLKTDGYPTYHLANIIDDHEMGITHIIRGEEWISTTSKHLLLYKAFGWQPPQFAHLPLLLNPDKSKLSKRQGDVAAEDYLKKGYLKEALLNFIALLGWNPGDEREIFSLDELIKEFSLEKIHKAGAVFDIQKLDWMNGEYIKKMDLDKLVEMAKPYLIVKGLIKSGDLLTDQIKKTIAIEQERISKLSEIGDNVKFLFADKLDYDPKILVWKKSTPEKTKEILNKLISELQTIADEAWNKENLERTIKLFIEREGLGNGDVLWPLRVALTGQEKSPTPFEIAEVLGKEKSFDRIKEGIEFLS